MSEPKHPGSDGAESGPPRPWWEQRSEPATPSPSEAAYQPAVPPPPQAWERSTAPTPWYRQRAAVLGIVGAVILAIVVLIFVNTGGDGDQNSAKAGDVASAGADEGQIKQLVKSWAEAFNNEDLAGMESLMCSGTASQLPTNLFPRHDIKGSLDSSVTNIVITGDRATARVVSNWSGGTHEAFENSYAKQGGVWKICRTLSY